MSGGRSQIYAWRLDKLQKLLHDGQVRLASFKKRRLLQSGPRSAPPSGGGLDTFRTGLYDGRRELYDSSQEVKYTDTIRIIDNRLHSNFLYSFNVWVLQEEGAHGDLRFNHSQEQCHCVRRVWRNASSKSGAMEVQSFLPRTSSRGSEVPPRGFVFCRPTQRGHLLVASSRDPLLLGQAPPRIEHSHTARSCCTW